MYKVEILQMEIPLHILYYIDRKKKRCAELFHTEREDIMTESTEVSFGLILNAGNSKSKSLMAIEAARDYDFEEAHQLIKEAKEDLKKAHQTQTDLIQSQARGETTEVDVILVHAQDHLTMAMMMLDQAQEFIHVYELLSKLLPKEER